MTHSGQPYQQLIKYLLMMTTQLFLKLNFILSQIQNTVGEVMIRA